MTISPKPPILDHENTLDRNSVVPLYHQLYEVLRKQIDAGVWKPGDMIPPESELKKLYGVSQITIRQALNNLVEHGVIYRQRGKGTFISQRMITSNLTHIVNFADDMRRRGHEPHTELIECVTAPISKSTAAQLRAEVGEEMVIIKRLRYADAEPLSLETSCLIQRYVPGILNNDFSKRSLSETLATDYEIVLSYAEQTIRAQMPTQDIARHLSISEDDPILVIDRVSYSQRSIPVEFLRIAYRADRYALHCELKGV
jgi:GntR family transcriptional regulator